MVGPLSGARLHFGEEKKLWWKTLAMPLSGDRLHFGGKTPTPPKLEATCLLA